LDRVVPKLASERVAVGVNSACRWRSPAR